MNFVPKSYRLLLLFINYCKHHGFFEALVKAKAYIGKSSDNHHLNYAGPYYVPEYIQFLSSIQNKKLIGSGSTRTIVWIMPTFNKGSGGHTTIFRFAKYFELMGFHNKFVIRNCDQNSDPRLKDKKNLENELYRCFYAPLRSEIVTYRNDIELLKDIESIKSDWVIGTCIRSQLIASNITYANKKYFFLQDNESLFTPADSFTAFNNAHFANEQNEFICAGDWLHSLVGNKNSACFQLGVDQLKTSVLSKFKKAKLKNDRVMKIAVYARFSTERRCVDLVWAYLYRLKEMGIDFEVNAFGQEIGKTVFPFKVIDHGVLSQNQMYRLLLNSDMCVALSATNYSLLPNEAAALGVISVDLDTPPNRLSYADSPVELIGPEVQKAANQLSGLIKQRLSQRIKQSGSEESQDFLHDLSWVNQYENIYQHLSGHKRSQNKLKVSVCIPVRNAGASFKILLSALQQQKLVDIELCIIDTMSSDGSIEIAEKMFPEVKVKTISKDEFGHGKTRNELARMASNEYLLFLTQDAIPLDELLIVSLVKHVAKSPKIFGSFCPHVAYPSHSSFLAHNIEKHFEHVAQSYTSSNFSTNRAESLKYRFFSTNCCAVRRSCLLQQPLPEVSYGEDQLWCFEMLEGGWGSAFVPDVSVLHSHDYDNQELIDMTKVDLEFHKVHFQEFPIWDQNRLDDDTKEIAKKLILTPRELQSELRKNKLRMEAYLLANKSTVVDYKK